MPSRDDDRARRPGATSARPTITRRALCGAGCDCLGLVRGVWRDLYGAEPETPPPYTPDWGETGETELLIEAARPASRAGAARGAGGRATSDLPHAARAASPSTPRSSPARDRMIHAQSRDKVREVTLAAGGAPWALAAFGWPE